MQIRITPAEQKQLTKLTAAKGRSKWFYTKAAISWASLQKLRISGQADEDVVKKARAVLRSKAAKTLIEQDMEAMAS